jgi:hypothetical protein
MGACAQQLALPLALVAACLQVSDGVRIYPAYNDVAAHPDVRGGRYATHHADFATFGNRSRWATCVLGEGHALPLPTAGCTRVPIMNRSFGHDAWRGVVL